jgi:two-component system nitrate/nitrite response regulator NarL
MNSPSVFLLEASPIFRSALRNVLSRIGALVVHCGPVTALENHRRNLDAILVDVATFPGDDHELADLIQRCTNMGPVVLLVREDRIDQIVTGFRSGAVGFVKQTASEHDIKKALDTVMAGSICCDRKVFRTIARYLLPVHQFSSTKLTKRELEVLQCVGRGDTNKEIAQCLQISLQSAKVYVSNLLRKTGLSNRAALAVHAIAIKDQIT